MNNSINFITVSLLVYTEVITRGKVAVLNIQRKGREMETWNAVKNMTTRKTEGLFHLLWSRNRGSLEYDGQQNKMFCKYCKATSSVCDRVFQLQRRDIHSGNLNFWIKNCNIFKPPPSWVLQLYFQSTTLPHLSLCSGLNFLKIFF